jgi:hypothetical protein
VYRFHIYHKKEIPVMTAILPQQNTNEKQILSVIDRMLTLGWSDGNTFCPLSFTHLSSDDRKNRYCEQVENLGKRTVGYRNRTQATRKPTDVMIDMLKQALTYVDSAKYA